MKWLEVTIIVCTTGYGLELQANEDDIRFLKEKLESQMSETSKFLILKFALLPTIYIQMIHTSHHLLHIAMDTIIFEEKKFVFCSFGPVTRLFTFLRLLLCLMYKRCSWRQYSHLFLRRFMCFIYVFLLVYLYCSWLYKLVQHESHFRK